MAKKTKVTAGAGGKRTATAPKTNNKNKNAPRLSQQVPQMSFTNFAQLENFILDKRDMFEHDLCIQVLTNFLNRPNINKSDQVKSYDLLGEIYLDSGNSVGALTCFEKSVQLDSSDHMKFMNLGQLYAMEPPTAQTMQTQTNKSLKCYSQGVEILKQKLALKPQDEALRQELVMAYCTIAELFMTDLCDVPEAEQRCGEALKCADELAPENPHVLQDMASFLITTHKNDLALIKLERVVSQIIACEPSVVVQSFPYDFQIATCRMLIELNKHAIAKPILTVLLQHFDECADVWYMLGHVILATTNNEELYKKHMLKAMLLAKGDMFEAEIKEELVEKFGRDVLKGIDLSKVDDDLDIEDEDAMVGGDDDDEWEDVDSDSDEEMNE